MEVLEEQFLNDIAHLCRLYNADKGVFTKGNTLYSAKISGGKTFLTKYSGEPKESREA